MESRSSPKLASSVEKWHAASKFGTPIDPTASPQMQIMHIIGLHVSIEIFISLLSHADRLRTSSAVFLYVWTVQGYIRHLNDPLTQQRD